MEQDLVDFLINLNTKHVSVKFGFKYSREKEEFLDMLFFKDKNDHTQNTLYKRATDRQNYTNSKSEPTNALVRCYAYKVFAYPYKVFAQQQLNTQNTPRHLKMHFCKKFTNVRMLVRKKKEELF